ncbi:FliM/FliN family flagellar motor switch protein [Palleronia sp. KMU-117]|uniref:FliM/FliN family flagellar motor switch protein n=1 Tax=Palleronia sp. KMU-117 TaxID=3434108 RepID=UPI003D7361DB
MTQTALSVMRRKAGALRGPLSSTVMSSARAWHQTLPRVADDHLGVELSVLSVHEAAQPATAAVAALPEGGLLMLMRDDRGRTGLCCLDAPALASVIEAQTTGQVGRAPPPERRPTATDAALVADLVDAVCAAFDAAVGVMSQRPIHAGARFAGYLCDARTAAMALSDGPLHAVRIAIDFGGGARQGALSLLMPPFAPLSGRADAPAAGRHLGEELRPVVMEGRVQLEAVLCRLRLPLQRIRALAPGDRLRVPAKALIGLSLEARDGRPVGRARLGQIEGRKAVRLSVDAADTDAAQSPQKLAALPSGAASPPGQAGGTRMASAPNPGAGRDPAHPDGRGGAPSHDGGLSGPALSGLSPPGT